MANAGYSAEQVVDVTWMARSPTLPGGKVGSTDIREFEQDTIDGALDEGFTVVNRRYPEVPMADRHTPEYVQPKIDNGQLPFANVGKKYRLR